MKLTDKLLYDAIALNHIKKQGGDMEKDLNAILSKKGVTVDKLLNMNAVDYMKNADEVMGTEQVGFGKEFVEETILSSELITRLRSGGDLLQHATIKPMGGKSVDVPVQGAQKRFVISAEQKDAPTGGASDSQQVKKADTFSINITATEMRITIYYSDTWLEDSVIGVAEYVLETIVSSYDCSIHQVLINGDDTIGTGNINASDGNNSENVF